MSSDNLNTYGIHIFRKDLRVNDNLALCELAKNVKYIIPIFILDSSQIIKTNANKNYHSESAVQFICESLFDLHKQTQEKLILVSGTPSQELNNILTILKSINVTHVSVNSDFTKYSIKRDLAIESVCKLHNITLIQNDDDQSLVPIENLCKSNRNPYMIYGAFVKNEKKYTVKSPVKFTGEFYESTVSRLLKKLNTIPCSLRGLSYLYKENKNLAQRGGRDHAIERIRKINIQDFDNRDTLTVMSFRLSAHLNFGCISIRELYNKFKSYSSVVSQLYWRDFYLSILKFSPLSKEYNFLDDRFKQVNWKQNDEDWKHMLNSTTGFLLIDASMAELKQTGYINGRSRLLLGTFWSKYLLIDPFDSKYGSQVGFSKYLVDCSTSQNKLNHHWLTSELDLTGRRFHKKGCPSLAGRVIRIDNQMLKKYDKNGDYVRQWLPQYKDMTVKDMIKVKPIFNWEARYKEYCSMIHD